MNINVEWDEVVLGDDMNIAIAKVLDEMQKRFEQIKTKLNDVEFDPRTQATESERGEFRLYYVCCSRCRIRLGNAKFIDQYL